MNVSYWVCSLAQYPELDTLLSSVTWSTNAFTTFLYFGDVHCYLSWYYQQFVTEFVFSKWHLWPLVALNWKVTQCCFNRCLISDTYVIMFLWVHFREKKKISRPKSLIGGCQLVSRDPQISDPRCFLLFAYGKWLLVKYLVMILSAFFNP